MAAPDRGKGARGNGEGGKKSQVDDLFQLPLAEFTAGRNALAVELKKSGDPEEAGRVKALAKPPLSAWVANQLYWRDRKAFDHLLAAGDRFRAAQAAKLGGKSADLRAPLDARREALAQLTRRAVDMLGESGHPASSDTMRRIMTTLEALATYSGQAEGPPAGRLTSDVDPPGFEALAALVPRGGASARQANAPPRVIPFTQATRETVTRRKANPEEEARKALLDAERALKDARRAAELARAAMKTAAARAQETEKAKAALETRFEKVSAAADAARQEARHVASQAEDAAQAMDDAERAVASAREALKNA